MRVGRDCEQASGRQRPRYIIATHAIPHNSQTRHAVRRNLPSFGYRVSTLSVRDLHPALSGVATRHDQKFRAFSRLRGNKVKRPSCPGNAKQFSLQRLHTKEGLAARRRALRRGRLPCSCLGIAISPVCLSASVTLATHVAGRLRSRAPVSTSPGTRPALGSHAEILLQTAACHHTYICTATSKPAYAKGRAPTFTFGLSPRYDYRSYSTQLYKCEASPPRSHVTGKGDYGLILVRSCKIHSSFLSRLTQRNIDSSFLVFMCSILHVEG